MSEGHSAAGYPAKQFITSPSVECFYLLPVGNGGTPPGEAIHCVAWGWIVTLFLILLILKNPVHPVY